MGGSGPGGRRSSKEKIAWIGAAAVVVAALVSGLFLYFSQGSAKASATSDNNVVVNMPPAATPPATPTFQPFQATVYNLPAGQCANVYSEPYLLSQDFIGILCTGTTVYIYCTAEAQQVGSSSVWDLIAYKTSWGNGGYIPDYYVYTGTNNAVEPSCST
ncbi:MAG: hypothetical protein ABSB76_14690 [Streptosporangiaceae bacterium]|jgi:hypothetical protein